MRGSVGAGGGGSRRLPGAPHAIAGSHPRRDVPPRRDRPRPTWRSIPVQVRRAYYHLLEGTNSLIQAAKARARGYRSKRKMIAITYLIAGKLPTPSPFVTHTI